MDRIEDFELLVRIIETGSLSAAAREAKTTQPTVSKRLKALESSLGQRLLHRNTRHVVPTEAGLACYRRFKRWLGELEELKLEVGGRGDEVAGPIRINAAVTVGAWVLGPLLPGFQKLHPAVEFSMELTDRRVDLVEDRADLAVRIGGVGNPDLIATRLGQYGFVVAASPQWAAEHPDVRTLAALQHHPVTTWERNPTTRLDGPGGPVVVRKDTRVTMPSSAGLRLLARQGIGPVLLARIVADEDLRRGDLVELIPGAHSAPMSVYALTLPVRPVPPRLKSFLAYLKRELPKVSGWQA